MDRPARRPVGAIGAIMGAWNAKAVRDEGRTELASNRGEAGRMAGLRGPAGTDGRVTRTYPAGVRADSKDGRVFAAHAKVATALAVATTLARQVEVIISRLEGRPGLA